MISQHLSASHYQFRSDLYASVCIAVIISLPFKHINAPFIVWMRQVSSLLPSYEPPPIQFYLTAQFYFLLCLRVGICELSCMAFYHGSNPMQFNVVIAFSCVYKTQSEAHSNNNHHRSGIQKIPRRQAVCQCDAHHHNRFSCKIISIEQIQN